MGVQVELGTSLIVCDLDGTLLNDNNQISAYTRGVFKRVQERGMKICLASGRANQMMTLFQEPYLPCDYQIAFNGGTAEDISLKTTRRWLWMTT